ncbi:hypothetical protein NST83_20515 [Paenibacillus sp. FSL R10-2782]|uniref:hypothetical protein n=1 Tax=Paenibacillus sp. FSL R10-2782 TaxID=2954661 RepID=UPI003158A5BD
MRNIIVTGLAWLMVAVLGACGTNSAGEGKTSGDKYAAVDKVQSEGVEKTRLRLHRYFRLALFMLERQNHLTTSGPPPACR